MNEQNQVYQELLDYAKNGGRNNVLNYCLKRLKDIEEAKDATQEVFISALTHLDKFRGDSKISSWMYTIARNYCNMVLRNRQRTSSKLINLEDLIESGDWIPIANENPENIFRKKEKYELLKEMLEKIPQDQKVAILLKMNGYSLGESIKELKIPLNTLKSRLHRAQESMKQLSL